MRLSTFRASVLTLVAIVVLPAAATAQYRPPSDPPPGEDYHVEIGGVLWQPTPELLITSESLGILGTEVDLVEDLGIEKKRHRELRVVLRPATKHKFRFHYLPMLYETDDVVQRSFVFNGLRYQVGLPVTTRAEIKTWRFGYEYDFLYRDRGYIGFLADLKFADVNVALASPLGDEFTKQAAPIPSFGGTGRAYLSKNVSITGEVTFFKVPENLNENYGGRYLDYDFYTTTNFDRNFGVQAGLRSVEVLYDIDLDSGDLRFKGWYFAGVLRF
jgi:hypothetical protein